MSEPTSRSFSFLSEVTRYHPDRYQPEQVYKFSNGRAFLSTDRTDHGFYRSGQDYAKFDEDFLNFDGDDIYFGN